MNGQLAILPNIWLDLAAEKSVHACGSVTATASVTVLLLAFSRAVGGGSTGIGPVHLDGGNHGQAP